MICCKLNHFVTGRQNKALSCPCSNKTSRLAGGLFLLFQLLPVIVFADEPHRVAHFPSWPGVSQLITYDQRVWLVNSQPYKDTNVADVYSYAPSAGRLSYERSLFSQDAGNPVVYQGLLYWPFEDPRRSAGAGEFAVTDGRVWQWNSMQSGSVMHVHAMNVCDNQLVAVTGSWTGQLHRQTGKKDWQLQYDYPSGAAPFSRLVNVTEYNGECFVAASANGKVEPKLFRIDSDGTSALQDWPSSDRVDSLTVHRDKLFAFADTGGSRQLLEFDGSSTSSLTIEQGHRPAALHSNGENLWLLTRSSDENNARGRLWLYTDDGAFESVATIKHPPISITSYANALYIGTYHHSGGGLWRYEIDGAEAVANADTKTYFASPVSLTSDNKLTEMLYDELHALLRDPASTENYARILRRSLANHPQAEKPEFGQAITRLLGVEFDSTLIPMFTRDPVPKVKLIRWYLLTTLAINGYGRVDPALIVAQDKLDSTGSGKQFEPSVAAIAATGWLNQNDPQTLKALISRLNRSSDPLWVKADVIGALSAVTGKSYGYDIAMWNRWWKNQL